MNYVFMKCFSYLKGFYVFTKRRSFTIMTFDVNSAFLVSLPQQTNGTDCPNTSCRRILLMYRYLQYDTLTSKNGTIMSELNMQSHKPCFWYSRLSLNVAFRTQHARIQIYFGFEWTWEHCTDCIHYILCDGPFSPMPTHSTITVLHSGRLTFWVA